MRLAALCDGGIRLIGPGEVEITGLAVDSRAVRPGELFAALAGSRTDGARFVSEALARGASALLGDAALLVGDELQPHVEVLQLLDIAAGVLRRALVLGLGGLRRAPVRELL